MDTHRERAYSCLDVFRTLALKQQFEDCLIKLFFGARCLCNSAVLEGDKDGSPDSCWISVRHSCSSRQSPGHSELPVTKGCCSSEVLEHSLAWTAAPTRTSPQPPLWVSWKVRGNSHWQGFKDHLKGLAPWTLTESLLIPGPWSINSIPETQGVLRCHREG